MTGNPWHQRGPGTRQQPAQDDPRPGDSRVPAKARSGSSDSGAAGATRDCGKGRGCSRVHGCRFPKDICARMRNFNLRRPRVPQMEVEISTRILTARSLEPA